MTADDFLPVASLAEQQQPARERTSVLPAAGYHNGHQRAGWRSAPEIDVVRHQQQKRDERGWSSASEIRERSHQRRCQPMGEPAWTIRRDKSRTTPAPSAR